MAANIDASGIIGPPFKIMYFFIPNNVIAEVAQSVWKRPKGWTAEISDIDSQIFSLLHGIDAVSGPHPASYVKGKGRGAVSPEIKWQVREADHLPPSIAKVKNA